jgi:hypothetical protein
MRKWFLLFLLSIPLAGQQINTDVIPATPGLNLGHPNQPWNIYANNIFLSGNCTITGGASCFGGAAAPSLSLQGNINGRLVSVPRAAFNATTGALTFTQPGVFTDSQMNQYVASSVGGLSFTTEFQIAEGSHGATEGLSGGVACLGTVLQCNGVAGYATNTATVPIAYGGYFQSRAIVNGAHVGAINSAALDTAGLTSGISMYNEDALTTPRNAPSAYSFIVGKAMGLNATQSGSFGSAFYSYTQNPGSSQWVSSFRSVDGGATIGVLIGSLAANTGSTTSNSQPLQFTSWNAGAANNNSMHMDQNGNLILTAFPNIAAANAELTGSLTFTAGGTGCLGTASGVVGIGVNCGAGGGVNPGTIHEIAEYTSTGSNVSGSSGLTENGTTLNYNANFSVAGPRPWIDVTGPGYGADPTGVADSTTALNKAFTNCSGGTVYLPPNTGGGFYKHTGQLTISTAGCTIQSFAQGAVIKKSYNSTGGFPGSNGSFVITGSNTIIDGIAYDGNNGSFTGPCITFSTAVTQVIFQNNYVHNCDGNSLTFTGSSTGATGPSNFRILNNTIIGGASGFPLQFSQDIEYFDIENNTFDGSAITLSGAGGPATLQLESQGLTTQISHGIIAHNTLISPNCSTGECWTVQLGQFNGYASTDIIYGPNLTLLSGNIANCGSFQGVRDSRFDLGICESNTGVSDAQNYTMWEFILDNNIDITGGTINGEGPGNSEGIIFSSTSNSTLSGVTINGFGESSTSGVTAGLEVSAAAAGAAQAITSCSESGNIATYTVTTPPLQAAWQPPATVYFGGSYTPSGYGGGPYTVINTNYNRISGTFSVVLPVTGLGNCTGTGTVQTGSWNNTFSGITINFPVGIYGSLTSTLYGIQERCTLAGGCYTSDNHFSGITINGTPGTSVTETGISIQGTGTADSNTFTDIQLNNLTNGIASTVGTNNNIIKPRFVNVGTHVSGTTGLYIDYMAPNAVPTITGCGTVTSQLGNGFAGSFNAASGTCTVVITPGETAINGFRCSAADITTPADTFTQTAKSTTTCTLTGTVTSGDLIQFSAAAY